MNVKAYYTFISNILLVFLSCILISNNATAFTVEGEESISDHMKNIGITFNQHGNKIDLIIDQQKSLDSIPALMSQGTVSNLDAKIVNVAPLSVSVVVIGISSTINIVNHLFQEDNKLDKVYVRGYVIPLGSTTKQSCYSFTYTRDKFMQLNLDILKPRDFVANTPGFTFSPWCKSNIETEAGLI